MVEKVWVITETNGTESMDGDGNINIIDRVSVTKVFASEESAAKWVASQRKIYEGSGMYAWWVPSYDTEEFEVEG